jgi:hypothetical protein
VLREIDANFAPDRMPTELADVREALTRLVVAQV